MWGETQGLPGGVTGVERAVSVSTGVDAGCVMEGWWVSTAGHTAPEAGRTERVQREAQEKWEQVVPPRPAVLLPRGPSDTLDPLNTHPLLQLDLED